MIKYDEFLEEYYWYWLNNIRNIGRRKISKLLKRFDSPKEIYNAGSEYLKCCGLSCKDAENIISSVKDEQIYRDYNALVKSSIKFTHPGKADKIIVGMVSDIFCHEFWHDTCCPFL